MHQNRLIAVDCGDDILPALRDTPVGRLLEYHNLDRPAEAYAQAELLIGVCMDPRVRLRLPENFAYVLRIGGANLRPVEFQVSYVVAVGGVRTVALIGHTQCGMVDLEARRDALVEGLVSGSGWDRAAAEDHCLRFAPVFEIGDEVGFVAREARRLRLRYPNVQIVPMLYRVEDHRLYLVREA